MAKMKTAFIAIICFALLALPGVALANGNGSMEGVATPEAGAAVASGDTISYEYEFINAIPEDGQFVAVRAELSAGLNIIENSAQLIPAQPPTEDEPQAVADFDMIYGNDGFVLIASSVSPGDKLVFKATLDSTAREALCKVYYGEEEYPIRHELTLPEAPATPAPSAAPRESAPEADSSIVPTYVWIIITGVCIAGLGTGLYFLIRYLKRQKQAAKQGEESGPELPEDGQ